MVVRRDDRSKSKMGKKIARTLVAGMMVVPGVLSNPLILDQNRSFADQVVVVDETDRISNQTIYRGQSINLASYGYSYELHDVVSSTDIGLYLDTNNFVIESQIAGSYTIYIYNKSNSDTEIDSFELTVKTPDFDNNNLVDISDLVKYFTSPPAVNSETTPITSFEIRTMFDWLDSSIQGANQAPEANNNLPILVNPSSPYITLSYMNSGTIVNSYFTDADGDELSYRVESVVPSTGAEARIIDNQLIIKPGSTPAHSVVTVRAYDEHGATADRDFEVNGAPIQVYFSDLVVERTAGTPHVTTFDLDSLTSPFFSDYEGHALTFSLDSYTLGSNDVTLDTNTNILSFTFVREQLHSDQVLTITATDHLYLSTSATFTVTFDDLAL